ncbi:MAG: glycerol-3-phosphate acyltransferase [bacterium]|nr:glycerol-3-phosphate acyltransferase [candidate division KSB1 bacterium]MDH7560851.1 glycerol-3-phosphate acyltransferase [bacterium]
MWLTAMCGVGGYLLGSVSPSYFLGRLLRGIDIREHGDGNAGTVNTFAVLGPLPSAVTALFDTGKGLAAMWLTLALGGAPAQAYLAGYAAVIGHVFPFYLGFRGGQGVATAVGLMLFLLGTAIVRGWLAWWHMAVLAGWVAVFAFISRRGEMVGVVVLPLLLLMVDTHASWCWELAFFNLVVAHVLFVNVYNIVVKKVVRLRPELRERVEWWRVLLRPGALAFPLVNLSFGQQSALLLTGAVLAISVVADLLRAHREAPAASTHRNSYLVHPAFLGGYHLSRITAFLAACFLSILLFAPPVALAAIVFVVFGDVFAKLFGLQWGRTPLLGKTVEGTLACLAVCLVAGLFMAEVLPLSPWLLLAGALVATAGELVPLGLNDNLVVPLCSGLVMQLLRRG